MWRFEIETQAEWQEGMPIAREDAVVLRDVVAACELWAEVKMSATLSQKGEACASSIGSTSWTYAFEKTR